MWQFSTTQKTTGGFQSRHKLRLCHQAVRHAKFSGFPITTVKSEFSPECEPCGDAQTTRPLRASARHSSLTAVDGTGADSQIRFRASVDMTAAVYALAESRPGLSPDAGNGSHERMPSPAMSCHQTDHSSDLN